MKCVCVCSVLDDKIWSGQSAHAMMKLYIRFAVVISKKRNKSERIRAMCFGDV